MVVNQGLNAFQGTVKHYDTQRPLKNPAIFTIPKKTMDFFEVTGGLRLVEPPARREGC